MAMTRADLLSQIEASVDSDEIQRLNLKFQAVEREMGILSRNMESLIRIINAVNSVDSPDAVLTNCRVAMESRLISMQAEYLAY